MKLHSFCILFFIACACPVLVWSQSNVAGKPFIINWLPKEYGANAQNWCAAQDKRGVMYFGNSDGLLEYDGVKWRTLEFAENSFTRSLAIGADNNIYIGGKGEIGYLLPANEMQKNSGSKNPFSRKYISLTKYLQPKDQDFTDVWATCISSKYVFFQTKKHIFRYTPSQTANSNHDSLCNNCMYVWTTDERFGGLSIVNDHIYTAIENKGLVEIRGDSMVPLPGGEKIDNGFAFIVPYNDTTGSKKILIGTDDQQLYIYDGKTCQLLSGKVADLIKQSSLYNAIVLKDGTIAIATAGSGVIIIDPSAGGKILQVFNKISGLKADIAYGVNVDKQGALWISTNNGISRVEVTSPVTSYDEESGLPAVGLCIEKFQNRIYIATEVGLSYLQEANTAGNNTSATAVQRPAFTPVQNLHKWSWCLLPVPGAKEMLAGTEDGVYRIRDNKATFLMSFSHDVICMYRSAYDSNRVFIGLRYGGIVSIYYNSTSDTWTNEGSIPGVDEYINCINESADGSLWLTAKYRTYLIRIIFPDAAITVEKIHKPQVKHYDTANGLPDASMIYTTIIAKELYAYVIGKIYKYNPSIDKFVIDTNIYQNPYSKDGAAMMKEDKAGNVWFDCNNIIYRAIPNKGGGYGLDSVSFLRVEPQQYYAMYADVENDAVWFAGSSELIHYDIRRQKNTNTDFPALIRSISLIGADSVIYDGLPFAGSEHQPSLPYKNNSLRFEYAATSYDNPSANQYQYFLQGFDKGWSAWTEETKKDYTNLPEGEYHFIVRAKNIYKHISKEDTYSFKVLPPWWRTWWAYVLYAISFIAVVSLIIRWRISSLHSEKLLLEEKVTKRTVELKAEKEKVESTLNELKSTQAQLIQSEKMASLGELTAGIAHEIQNPLNFVNNFSDVNKELIDELQGERSKAGSERNEDLEDQILNDIKQNLEKINHHGKRADSIVKGMLQHSRKSEGKKVPTDINALCDEYLRLSYHGLRAKDKSFNADFKTDFDRDLSSVEAKINIVPQDIGRVLLNLFNNAFYATNEKFTAHRSPLTDNYKPLVSVTTRKVNTPSGDGSIEIIVKDNGSGIPQNIADKIFQPFFTTKPTGQGTGLGLSLSYDIIKVHGGEIKVETKAEVGTTFIIQLPIV
jgi:signal transduction histidine kinase/streptogramin lyase